MKTDLKQNRTLHLNYKFKTKEKMKKITLIAALCLGLGTSYAQKVKEAEVPVAVKDAFAKKYPGMKAEWQKEDAINTEPSTSFLSTLPSNSAS